MFQSIEQHRQQASLLFNWRRLAREGGFGEIAGAIRFAPAIVTDDTGIERPGVVVRTGNGQRVGGILERRNEAQRCRSASLACRRARPYQRSNNPHRSTNSCRGTGLWRWDRRKTSGMQRCHRCPAQDHPRRHDPPILRRVEVPFDIRLDRLHLTVQAAMGWTDSHSL